MKIVVYVNEAELSGIQLVTNGILKTHPNFTWRITTNETEFLDACLSFRILADDDDGLAESADLSWPPPSKFLKNEKLKEKVWDDVQNIVIPASLKEVTVSDVQLSESEIVRLLSVISTSSAPFLVTHPNGYTIGVNTRDGADVVLTNSDLASMYVASLLFKAKQVQLKVTPAKSLGKGGAA